MISWCNLVVANDPSYRYVDWWRGEVVALDKDSGPEVTTAPTGKLDTASESMGGMRKLRTRSEGGQRVLTSQAQVEATRRCNERVRTPDTLLNGLRERYQLGTERL